MSAMARQSKYSRVYEQSDSPVTIPHATFVGLALSFSNAAAVATVSMDMDKEGDFDNEITMEGTTKHRWPNVDGMNRLYNAGYVRIEWDVGTLRVLQKG